MSVLHTWGSALAHHPHAHMVVPGGGLSPDGSKWIACRPRYFLTVEVLSALFRRLFLQMLVAACRLVKQATQLAGGHRRAGLTARKQPTFLKGRCGIETPAHLPPLPQQIERLRRQHNIAILAALGLLDANDQQYDVSPSKKKQDLQKKKKKKKRTVMQAFSDTLGQVFRAIAANKLRSFLTMFGIAWGVGSLLVLVGLGEGFRSGQHRQLATFGNDVVMMWNATIPARPTEPDTNSKKATTSFFAELPRRALHPDWTWLDDPETRAKMFEPSEAFSALDTWCSAMTPSSPPSSLPARSTRPGHATVISRSKHDPRTLPPIGSIRCSRNASRRYCSHPDTWHMVNPLEPLWPVLGPLLEAAGFVLHSSSMRMQWGGELVAVPDPSPARFVRYAGGNSEMDKAIVELHNRSYRSSLWLMTPWRVEQLWQSWPGLTLREYVLAMEHDRLVGYAEWFVVDGKPCINSFVAARSHWGTPVGAAVGTKAMQTSSNSGTARSSSASFSTNAPSMKLHLKHGWHVAAEQARSYVRKL